MVKEEKKVNNKKVYVGRRKNRVLVKTGYSNSSYVTTKVCLLAALDYIIQCIPFAYFTL